MQNTKTIMIYGDSVMKGVVFEPDTMRYTPAMDELIAQFGQACALNIVNRSQFGYTVEKGMRRVEGDLSSGLCHGYALLEFGGNDCNFRWKDVSDHPEEEHKPATPLEKFVLCYKEIIRKMKGAGVSPVLMTLPPVDAEKYLDFLAMGGLVKENIIKWLGDAQMIYRYHERYSNAVRKIAQDTGSFLVDVRSYFLDHIHYKKLICDDGLHVSREGQKLIYRAFDDFVRDMRLLKSVGSSAPPVRT